MEKEYMIDERERVWRRNTLLMRGRGCGEGIHD